MSQARKLVRCSTMFFDIVRSCPLVEMGGKLLRINEKRCVSPYIRVDQLRPVTCCMFFR